MSLDVDLEQRLEDIEEKIDHNSKILRSLNRKQIFDFWFGIIKLCIFIGAFYYAYHFAEPLLVQIKEAYVSFQGLSESVDSMKGNPFFDFFSKSATSTSAR